MVSCLIKISLSYSTFRLEKTDSPGYDTPGSQKHFAPRTLFKNEKFSLLIVEYESITDFFNSVLLKACAKVKKKMAVDSLGS